MQDEINGISNNLFMALQKAQALQIKVQEQEGDSDLHRKISNYLIPNLLHWIDGAQAGSVKDLTNTIEGRTNAKNRN